MSFDATFYLRLQQRLGNDCFKSYVNFERQSHVARMDYSNPDYDDQDGSNKTPAHEDWVRAQIELDRVTKPEPHSTKTVPNIGREHPSSVRNTLKRAFAEFRDRETKAWKID